MPGSCTSIGRATDSATALGARAPEYRRSWTTGGVICGNCAIGNACIATKPTTTMTIEITAAKMGRSMKAWTHGVSSLFVLDAAVSDGAAASLTPADGPEDDRACDPAEATATGFT